MGGVAVDDWGVSFFNGSWMVNDNNLGHELFDFFGRINHGISCNESSLDLVNFELDVETDVVSGVGELNLFMVHFDGFNVSFKVSWSENDVGFLSENSSFDSADSNCSVSFDFVNIIDGDSQWLLNRSFWSLEIVNGLREMRAVIPGHVGRFSCQILSTPS